MSRYLLSATHVKVTFRGLSVSLLALTLVTGAYYLLRYVPKHVKAGEPVLALANYFLTYTPIEGLNQPVYVVPDSIEVWDTPAEIRTRVTSLQSGDEVQALGHFRNWTHVRTLGGQEGWVNADGLVNAETHAAEERLCQEISDIPAQAEGHTSDLDNIHIEPSRQAAVVAEANPAQRLEIFGRRMVPRTYENGRANRRLVSSGHYEAWYLVQVGSHVGWILGQRVHLDIPQNISAYAQDTNLVAWIVLDTVDDGDDPMPQYLVADRVGIPTCDFTDIRVLTWWKRKQTYAIAYKLGGLQGYFPILVTHQGSVPYFRLRLVDEKGVRKQWLFGLFDTITRAIGTGHTWQSDVIPESRAFRPFVRQARARSFLGG